MSNALPFSAAALLASIEGVAYAVDKAGIILGFSRGPFLPEYDGHVVKPWDCNQAVGKCLFDLLQGDQVRNSYHTLHQAVWSGSRYSVGFEYRCDAPEIERCMRMSLSLITTGSKSKAVLYQSIIISESPRVPLPLFAADMLSSRTRSSPGRQIVTLCSYCQRVAWPVGMDVKGQAWIEAAEFYRRGGHSDVAVSHGVCEACFHRIVGPVLPPMASNDPIRS
jgi:hypothetical protein